MISKELISEIMLDTDTEECCYVELPLMGSKTLYYSVRIKENNTDGTSNFYDEQINLYDFYNKCKKWAFDVKNCMFDIRYHTNSSNKCIAIMTYGKDSTYFHGITEEEAIIKLCEWLLNNKVD